MRHDRLRHCFVEFIPEVLEEGVLYISMEYMTVSHKCCCGCGNEVSIPLSPTDWRLIYDGKTISLEPSIGSWSLPCKSHYWIRNSQVRWAEQWTPARIQAGRAHNARTKHASFATQATTTPTEAPPTRSAESPYVKPSRWECLKAAFRRK